MPVVNIPDRGMVIQFPDEMSPADIERAIYASVYDRYYPKGERKREPLELSGKPRFERTDNFDQWYSGHAARLGLSPDPDDPRHKYDYRAAFRAGAEPDETGHWPSRFKAIDHPDRFVGGIDTITGEKVPDKPGQPVISAEEPPSATEKVRRFVSDLFPEGDPGLGPLTERDRAAFEPAEVPGLERPAIVPKPIKEYASYAPYIAVKAFHDTIRHFIPLKKPGAVGDIDTMLQAATDFWRKEVGDTVQIPNVGIGSDEKGNLRIEPREPIGLADLLGETAGVAGAVAGPVRTAIGAGGLIAEKLSRYARPFYRKVLRGMIGGALLGEGKKDETLQNMVLFATLEVGGHALSRLPKVIQDSTAWRRMTIKERGLALQSIDDVIQRNPDLKANELEVKILKELKTGNPELFKAFKKESIRARGLGPPAREVPKAKVEPKPAEAPRAKEAWEMTRGEFEENLRSIGVAPLGHKTSVQKALSEGKPVPAEVLKDYPDLKAPEAEAPPSVEAGVRVEKAKKKVRTGPLGLIGRIRQKDPDGRWGIKVPKGWNIKELRQFPDMKRVLNQKTGIPIDDMAASLKTEGYPIKSDDDLRELLETGGARKVFSVERSDEMVERYIKSLAKQETDLADNDMIEYLRKHPEEIDEITELSDEHRALLQELRNEDLESAAIAKAQKEHETALKDEILGEIKGEEDFDEATYQAVMKEWDAMVAEKPPVSKKPFKLTPDRPRPPKPAPKPTEAEIEQAKLEKAGQQVMPVEGKAKARKFAPREKAVFGRKRKVEKPAVTKQRDMFTAKGKVVEQEPDLVEMARMRAAKKPKAKEPWEMTQEDYVNANLPMPRTKPLTEATIFKQEKLLKKAHRNDVVGALSENRQVPDAVLADYPDLVKKPEVTILQEKYISTARKQGSWEASVAINYFERHLKPIIQKLKGKWLAVDGFSKKGAESNRQALDALKDMDALDVVWDTEGMPYYSLKGTPKPVGPRFKYEAADKAKPTPGSVFIKEKQYPFREFREIRRGKNKGKIQVVLPGNKKAIVAKADVGKWPDEIREKAAAAKAPSGVADVGGYADTGGYAELTHSVIQMPEIVQLAKDLLAGKYPKVRLKLRQRMAAGIFYPKGKGRIELKADIFEKSSEAAKVLSHEIGHLVDWLPEKTMARGNILGRIASLKKYMKHTMPRALKGEFGPLTQKDRQRLRREAKKLLEAENKDKYIDEVITKELPITPKDVLAIWNAVEGAGLINPELLDYVKRLNTAEKKSIVKEAMKGQVPAQLQSFAKKVTEKTGKKIKVEITKDLIAQKYRHLLNKEIAKRKMFQLDEVMDELKALTREWKPFDPAADPKFTKYRYSSKELYADAISAIINAPGFARARAPLFYEGFFNYLEKKPEVKKLYDQIQDDIKSGDIEKQRMKGLYDMFRRGDDAYALSLKPDVKFRDLLAREFIDANWFILKKVKDIGERTIPAGENPRYKLEEMAYSGSESEWYIVNTYREVLKPLEGAGFNWDDFGVERFLRWVSTGRMDKANSRGWTPELAEKKLAELKEMRTPRQNEVMRDAIKAARKTHEYIIDKGVKAERWSDDLVKIMRDEVEYATFDVIKYIEKRHGLGPSAKIFATVGTLEEVANPATATMLKDIAMIKTINRQIAADSVVKFLQKNFADEIEPAKTKWNGKFHEIKDPERGTRKGLMVYLHKGKAQGYYVDKYIADTFQGNPWEGQAIAKVLSSTIQPFRMAFTELNYGFWMFNIHRDYFRAAQILPKAKISTFLPYYLKGLKPAFKSVYGIPNDVATEMLKGNMLISVTSAHGLRPADREIERMLKMYHMSPGTIQNNMLKPFGKVFNYYTNIGRGFERTTKMGSYLYLKQKFPEMSHSEIGHIIRTMGGSPDFLRLGRAYPIYNNTLMFSNAMKEGYRGDYEAMSRSPSEFWWKKAKYTFIPKMLMYAGSLGLLGAGIKAIYDGASEYDKTNYVIVPLGLTETGKSVYWRIPLDETSRLMGGILWKTMSRDTKKMTTGLFDYMAGQAPTIHPGVDILIATIQYASGLNPYDHFKGRYAIPEQIFEAGGERSHKAFMKWLANKAGASLVYKFRSDDIGEIKSELEKVVGYPFASNIVGRFVKVSNRGITETLKEIKFDVRRENMRAILDAKDALNKLIKGDEPLSGKDLEAILKKPDIIDRNIMVGLARKYGQVYFKEFMTATSSDEKAAVLKEMLQRQAVGMENK